MIQKVKLMQIAEREPLVFSLFYFESVISYLAQTFFIYLKRKDALLHS